MIARIPHPKVVLPLAVVAIGTIVAVGLVRSRPAPEKRTVEVPAPLVRVRAVFPETVRLDVASYGEIRPRSESELVAQVAGTIVEMSPDLAAGGYFEAGETLAVIDPRDYRIAVTHAESAVAQARVQLALQEGEARVARREWEDLGEGEPDPLVLREPQVLQAKAALDAAGAALEKARLDLGRTRITAPYAGRVREQRVDLGQFVAPGTPIARVFATDAVEVRLPVPTDELGYVDLPRSPDATGPGPDVVLEARMGGRTVRWNGRIVRTEGALDRTTRMLHAVARIDEPWGGGANDVPPTVGLFVDARIAGRTVENVYRVPRSALVDGRRLLLVDADDRLRLRDVEIVRLEGETAIVAEGITPGDRVCLSAPEVVVEGMAVRPAEDGGDA